MRYLIFSAVFFGLAILLSQGGLSSLGMGRETVTFREARGQVTWLYAMTVFAEPPLATALMVEGTDGPEPVLPDTDSVTIVTGWASWCGVCRRELPALAQLQADTGVTVRAVSVERRDSLSDVSRYLIHHRVGSLAPLRDTDGGLAALLGGRAVPSSLVVDRYGQVVGRFIGGGPWGSATVRDWLKALSEARTAEESRLLYRDFTGS